jgi:hypothetical protein
MTVKNPTERHKRFLSAGFFAPEMPPCFYSETFTKCRSHLIDSTKTRLKDRKEPEYYTRITKKTAFRFPRFGTADRPFSLINPIAYFFLSKTLADNYVALKALNKKSKITASPSIFDWSGTRTLKRPSFDSRDTYLSDIDARFECIVSTDLRAFYHSIYTHSIAWAVHGKQVAKKIGKTIYMAT